ncbi:XRE family transcriptional regulator [Caballeronia hypogeia]|uniref:XRE family transcriptional regulator n=2 Tax=Caballeronia hypogeia TaxID=1777140 RepID=A0A158D1L3_9BURK|nr:XRE family transcriptional regulator [Caballeronia hypogeia]
MGRSSVQAVSEPAEAGIDRVALGQAIRSLRKAQAKTLADLASATGRSVSFISQLERGNAESTISDLRRLANTLGVPLNWFLMSEFKPAEEVGHIVRAASRRKLETETDGLVEEVLSPSTNTGGVFVTFLSTIAPGALLAEPIERDTEEEGYVVKGELELWIEDQASLLTAGDSFRIDGQPYRWVNRGETEAVVVWVVSSPTKHQNSR